MEDEVVAPVETPAVDATPVTPADAPHEPPPVDDNEAMWGDLKPDEPAAPEAPAIPEEFAQALQLSEYVKDAAQLRDAVASADQMYQVEQGKIPAWQLMENARSQNPQAFQRMFTEMQQYVEHVTGKKFGGEATPPDPIKSLEERLAIAENLPVRMAEQQRQQEFEARAYAAGSAKVNELIKAGNGIFEGDTQSAEQAVARQFAAMKLDPQKVAQEVANGNTANLEKAYKAAEKAETLRVKAYADRIKARYLATKNSVPATAGAGKSVSAPADGFDLTTKAGRAKAMTAAWNAGSETV